MIRTIYKETKKEKGHIKEVGYKFYPTLSEKFYSYLLECGK